MKRIGITGQSGFIGTHLYHTLGLFPEEFERIPFEDEFFDSEDVLRRFAGQCDVIVHLAAVNRHNDPEVLYQTNIELSRKLANAIELAGNRPHVMTSSSIQEFQKNAYGESKKIAREILAEAAGTSEYPFSGFIFPNVFGPFGRPFYNSFIATFCHLLTTGGEPEIKVDNEVPLIYVGSIVDTIIDAIRTNRTGKEILVQSEKQVKVSKILTLLENYATTYQKQGIIPELRDRFETELFNTFRSYIDPEEHFPVKLLKNKDIRGGFVEIMKTGIGGQVSFSTTKPGITRGNHFHTRKIERFAVIRGEATIELRKIGNSKKYTFQLDGKHPAFVDMPVWFTHNITNTGTEDLYTIFWINEFYDPEDPDTYFEKV